MENIFKNIEIYYSMAIEYYRGLSMDESEEEIDMKSLIIKENSIVYVIDHCTIPNNSIGIRLNLYLKDKILSVGYYTLYVDLEMNFVDEFFVLN